MNYDPHTHVWLVHSAEQKGPERELGPFLRYLYDISYLLPRVDMGGKLFFIEYFCKYYAIGVPITSYMLPTGWGNL